MKKVFVSFDYENDKQYKYLLEAWDANDKFEFKFYDLTPNEIRSEDIGRIKAGLTAKIKQATHTLVIVGKEANRLHLSSEEIGFRNWINFEVRQSINEGNKIAIIKLSSNCALPEELSGEHYWYITGFSEKNVAKVLEAE
ncbi:MAG: TIR domain-containing protein [Patescibacteria group bacterium]|nr:TIR domain-containing protein [Patescibacteria group bacterium]